jgi:ELWxxDGT repeat protein
MRLIRSARGRLLILAALAALALAGVGPVGYAAPPDPAFLVKQIGPGGVSITGMKTLGSQAYFTVGGIPTELWQTDGTNAGTVKLPVSGVATLDYVFKIGSRVIYFADTGGGVSDLRAYDTTLSSDASLKSGVKLLMPWATPTEQASDTVYFLLDNSNVELWKTDGTNAGTVKITTLRNTPPTNYPSMPTVIGGTTYFIFDDGTNGYQIWKTDGTAGGTGLVKAVDEGGSLGIPGNLTAVGSKLVFTAYDSVHGREPWVTDGTDAGTFLLADVTPGATGSFVAISKFERFAAAGGNAYFITTPQFSPKDLWKTNGTSAGTVLVKALADQSPSGLTAVGTRVFFRGSDPTTGTELWVSDGTAAGTRLARDINQGGSSSPGVVLGVGNIALLTATTAAEGAELWRSDGTSAGTALVADINPGSDSSSPSYFAVAGDYIVFGAEGSLGNRQLWGIPRSALPSYDYGANLPLVVAP